MAINVSPDGPRIISLSEDAASVIVGNPAHASVVLDNPRLMIITARVPGMTRLTVLGRNGKVIMSENVIVNGAASGLIRVRNACINGGEGCAPTKMYFCEPGDACHNIVVNEPVMDGGAAAANAGAGAPATTGAPSNGELEGGI